MNGAVSGMRSGFRSLLCCVVCIQSDWATAEMYFWERTTYPLFSDTRPTFCMPLLFIGRERLIRFQQCLKSIYAPKKSVCSARPPYTCPVSRLERICDSQHIFWKWPFRMSNEGYDNIILHLTHLHEPSGKITVLYFSGLYSKWTPLNKHFLSGIPLTGGATWTATLTLIRWREQYPQRNSLTERA